MKLDRHIVRLLARLPLPQGRIQAARMWIAEWLDQHTVLCRAWLMAWGVGVIPFWRIQRANGCPGGETTLCGKCWYLGICGYDQSPAPPEDMGGEYGGGYPPIAAAATVAAKQEGVD